MESVISVLGIYRNFYTNRIEACISLIKSQICTSLPMAEKVKDKMCVIYKINQQINQNFPSLVFQYFY